MALIPPVRYHRNDPHHIAIVVSPASVTRESLHITVHQQQDAAGNWLMPTITFNQAIPQTSEDVIFMKSIAEGLLVACLEAIAMMEFVT